MDNLPQAAAPGEDRQPPISRKLTHFIIAANVVVFLLMVIADPRMLFPRGEWVTQFLKTWGANSATATMTTEPWRLVTYMFIHIGFLHLAFNMYVFNALGPIVNEFFGRRRFLVIYFLAGIGSGITSAWWNPQVLSAGASGAIFGLVGCLIGYFIIHRNSYDPAIISENLKSLVLFVAFNVYFGFAMRGIDNAAHLGGLGFGLVAGVLLSPRPTWQLKWGWRSSAAALLLVAILAGGGVLARARVMAFIDYRDKLLQKYELLYQRRRANRAALQRIMPALEEIIKNNPQLRNRVLRLRIVPEGTLPPPRPAEEKKEPPQIPGEEAPGS